MAISLNERSRAPAVVALATAKSAVVSIYNTYEEAEGGRPRTQEVGLSARRAETRMAGEGGHYRHD